jgi:hypothetical protein
MRYEEIKDRSPADFQRLTGVKPQVFEQMLQAVQSHIRSFGRPCKLCLADQLLLTLMYWREYRTMFHIAQAYGVSEPTVHRTILKIERALLASKQFRLPGKKALLEPDMQWQVVLVDATETPVERPQKNRESITAARRSATPAKPKS